MLNKTLTTITLDNLADVTGGNYPADGGSSPVDPPGVPQGERQALGARAGRWICQLPVGLRIPAKS